MEENGETGSRNMEKKVEEEHEWNKDEIPMKVMNVYNKRSKRQKVKKENGDKYNFQIKRKVEKIRKREEKGRKEGRKNENTISSRRKIREKDEK